MKKNIVVGQFNIGSVLATIDTNFIEVCNQLLKLVDMEYTLKGYADAAIEPTGNTVKDCYLVQADGSLWGLTVEKDDLVAWDGAAWEVLSFKITELNAYFQSMYFNAGAISCTTPYGMTAVNVQAALEELAAAVFGVPVPDASGSASGGGV